MADDEEKKKPHPEDEPAKDEAAVKPEEKADEPEPNESNEPTKAESEEKPTVNEAAHEPASTKPKFSLKAFVKTTKGKITLAAIGVVILALAAVFAVPSSRYATLGLFIKKDVGLTLVDSKSGKPVSDAQVDIPGQTGKTDNQGKIQFKGVPVGPQQVVVKKKHFKDLTQTVNVWLTKGPEPTQFKIEATGRQVPVTVVNKVSGQPVEKAVISVQESTAITDDKGEAVLLLPVDATELDGSVKLQGYNDLAIKVTNVEQADPKNTFSLTPTGKLYFLSKRTGKINVMKSDLDGTNAQVVVEGTGKEEEGQTVLLASRDWRYLMLKSRRDSDLAKLYLIDTSNDKLTVADEGNAEFNLAGWADHLFVYNVVRNDSKRWQDGYESIKSFNAENGKLTKLDTLRGGHLEYQPFFYERYYANPLLIGNEVIFSKNWDGHTFNAQLDGKKDGVYRVKADGSDRKTLVESDSSQVGFYEIKLYNATEVYIRSQGTQNKSWEYEHGELKEEAVGDDDFYKSYPTYLVSPSGNATFWTESRDGKNVLFVGDKDGEGGKEVTKLHADYKQFGWFTEDYLLVSKNSSELFILSKNNPGEPVKITDYHKPSFSFYAYGGGYGGF